MCEKWLHGLWVSYFNFEKSIEEIFEEVSSEKLCIMQLDQCSQEARKEDLERIDIFLELAVRLMRLEKSGFAPGL